MSTITGISGSGANGSSGSAGLSAMSPQDFLKVIFTELQSQDPLQPTDSNALMQQLSTLQNIQSQMDLQQQLASLVLQNKIAAGGGMIGKMVQGLDTGNNNVTGVVSSVLVQDNDVVLQLDNGSQVSMKNVTGVASAPTAATTPTTGTGSATDTSALAQQLAALLSGTGTTGS